MEFEDVPQDCIANILSFTTPRDACVLSLVSTTFKSAANSDVVWESFLPSDYRTIIPSSLSFPSKKHLFLYLSQNPILIHDGLKSFVLDKVYGKKCYMLSARILYTAWGDTPHYWRWTSLPDSRFSEVAELVNVCWFDIKGRIKSCMLSPKTLYGAYLVFKPTVVGSYGFDYQQVEVSVVGIVGEGDTRNRSVYLVEPPPPMPRFIKIRVNRYRHLLANDEARGPPPLPPAPTSETTLRWRDPVVQRRRIYGRLPFGSLATIQAPPWSPVSAPVPAPVVVDPTLVGVDYPGERADGWWEIEIGDFFNKGGEKKEVEISVYEVKSGDWKGGIVLQGIEIRPKLNPMIE